MNKEELRRIEERAEKANCERTFDIFDAHAIAELYQFARKDIPALLARVRELEADNEALKKINIMNVNSSDRAAASDQTRIRELEAQVEKYRGLEEAVETMLENKGLSIVICDNWGKVTDNTRREAEGILGAIKTALSLAALEEK